MSHWKSFGLAIFTAVCLLGETTLWSESANANIIFDFRGQGEFFGDVPCPNSICSDTTSIGVLTLTDNYVYGTDITTSNFLSFILTVYSSSDEAIGFFYWLGGMQSFQLPEGGLNLDGSFDAAGQLGFSQGPSIFNVDQGGFSAGYKFVFN